MFGPQGIGVIPLLPDRGTSANVCYRPTATGLRAGLDDIFSEDSQK